MQQQTNEQKLQVLKDVRRALSKQEILQIVHFFWRIVIPASLFFGTLVPILIMLDKRASQAGSFAVGLISAALVLYLWKKIAKSVQWAWIRNPLGGLTSALEILNDYQPVDEQAFRDLQQYIIQYGVSGDQLSRWVRVEQWAVEESMEPPSKFKSAKEAFLKREV